MAVYCAAAYPHDYRQGMVCAVNHSGDSAAVGAVFGGIHGIMHGISAIPAIWIRHLELTDLLHELANDLKIQLSDEKDWIVKYLA